MNLRHLSHLMANSIIAIMVICIGSCNRVSQDPKPDRVELARQSLQNIVCLMESNPDGSESQTHAIKAINQAILKLDGKTAKSLNDPLPIMASLGSVAKLRGGLSLRIDWVDPGFDATGLFIVDGKRKETAFEHVIAWTASERDQTPSNGYLRMGFPVEFDEETTKAWEGASELRPPLHVDVRTWDNATSVGLITKEGRRTATVEIFVEQSARWHASAVPAR